MAHLGERTVVVRAPARLHMGFLDPNGISGRRFGSLGVALEGIETEVVVRPAPQLSITGHERERVGAFLHTLLQRFAFPPTMAIEVRRAIPPHVGLGSGTQLHLALGVAIAHFWGREISPRQVAALAGRGRRSGIGVAAFELGGFLVDGGRDGTTEIPPLIARLPVPPAWRWLLIFDRHRQGLHGEEELRAFQRPGFFPPSLVDRLLRRLWVGLAALAEGKIGPFARFIDAVQEANGNYFSPIQGGVYGSQTVGELLEQLRRMGYRGIGQSSWGPTGFCLLPSEEEASRLAAQLRSRWGEELTFKVVASRNRGAVLEVDP